MRSILIFLIFIPIHLFGQMEVRPAFDILKKYPKVRDLTIGPLGNEAYCTIQSPLEEVSLIARLTRNGKEWRKPELVRFSSSFRDLEPFLSPDGLRLYFVSNRPLKSNTDSPKDYDIWYVERLDRKSEWSSPKNLGSTVNTERDEFYPSVANNGNLYFTLIPLDGGNTDDIFFSEWTESGYTKPKALQNTVNTEGYEFNSFIAPDESYSTLR